MMDRLQAELETLVRGRRVLIGTDAAAAATSTVTWLQESGAGPILVVAGSLGTGDQPNVETILMPPARAGDGVMTAIRRQEALRAEPPQNIAAAVEAFDPDRTALVLVPVFSTAVEAFGGRAAFGSRPPAWAALEDKTRAEAVWQQAGVAHAPAEVVPVAAAIEAAARLDQGLGTVWAADNRDGWHGGGSYTRWLGPGADPVEMQEWFAGHADHVRVMPFLEGIPCSIHGFVGPDRVGAFRPMEMVTLRHAERPEFVYGGVSSFWDPAPHDREEMRAAAGKVGAWLRATAGYRGPFSIDGVMTRNGFRPTELNPRLSRGFGQQAALLGGPDVGMVVRAFVAGLVDLDPAALEAAVLPVADRRRTGGLGMAVPVDVSPAKLHLTFSEGEADVVDEGDATATLELGPAVQGGYLSLRLHPERCPSGASVGPLAVAAARLAADFWDLPIPPLAAAPDVRRDALSGTVPD